jgi:hypothetical protein
MNDNLIELLDFPWFEQIGQPLDENVTRVFSWGATRQLNSGGQWQSLKITALNNIALQVRESSRELFDQWERISNKCLEIVNPVIENDVRSALANHNLPRGCYALWVQISKLLS